MSLEERLTGDLDIGSLVSSPARAAPSSRMGREGGFRMKRTTTKLGFLGVAAFAGALVLACSSKTNGSSDGSGGNGNLWVSCLLSDYCTGATTPNSSVSNSDEACQAQGGTPGSGCPLAYGTATISGCCHHSTNSETCYYGPLPQSFNAGTCAAGGGTWNDLP
jgi:hypothetical protein